VSYGQVVRRGGGFNRLVEPSWQDPLDTGYSKSRGGRWNPPGSFGVLYLNASEPMARLQVDHKLAGQPYSVEDLNPTEQHDLVDVQVTEADVLDCASDQGLQSVGLPVSYPFDDDARPVPHEACQPVGEAGYLERIAGIACRSAVAGAARSDEELAVFDRSVTDAVTQTGRRSFADWYFGETSPE
jgi:RES domain-containing protein